MSIDATDEVTVFDTYSCDVDGVYHKLRTFASVLVGWANGGCRVLEFFFILVELLIYSISFSDGADPIHMFSLGSVNFVRRQIERVTFNLLSCFFPFTDGRLKGISG